MSLNDRNTLNPYKVGAVAWTLALIVVGAALVDWRYRFSYEVPTAARAGDLGFRFDFSKRSCLNTNSEAGTSPGFLGACGVAKDLDIHRGKFIETILIAGQFGNSTFSNSIFDWVKAHASRWANVKFLGNLIWDSEFPMAEFVGVQFVDSDLRGPIFSGAKFIDCEFRNSKILDASFRGTTFLRTKFVNTTCSNCDFSSAKFQESSIDRPFEKTIFNMETVLPFPIEQVGKYGFEFRDGI